MKIDAARYNRFVAAIPSGNGPRRPQALAANDGVALILAARHPVTLQDLDIHVAWTGQRRKPKERSLYVEAGDVAHTLVTKKEMGAWVAGGRLLPAGLTELSADLHPLLDAFMEAEMLYLKARAIAAGAEATKMAPTMKPGWRPWARAGFPAPALDVSKELAAVVRALQ